MDGDALHVIVGDVDLAGMKATADLNGGRTAGADEVLVSRTVKDLVAGSGLRFNERGKHSLASMIFQS